MNIYIRTMSVLIVLTAALSGISTVMSQHSTSPHQHEAKPDQKRAAEVNQRGDRVMGFDHKKTTHRFVLTSDGGVIEVTGNDATDVSSKDQIVSHLSHIAMMFAEGNFESPML